MKKWMAGCLVAMSLLGLCACSQSAAYTTGLLSMVEEAGAFSEELEVLDQETAFMVYRLGDYELEQESLIDCAALRSSGATCEEGVVLVWESQKQAQQALTALKDYVESQIETNENYRPNEIPKLEGARVEQLGNSVVLIVATHMDVVTDVISKIG